MMKKTMKSQFNLLLTHVIVECFAFLTLNESTIFTFQAADTKLDNGRTDGQLDIDEFMDFYRMLTKRTEMEDLFHK